MATTKTRLDGTRLSRHRRCSGRRQRRRRGTLRSSRSGRALGSSRRSRRGGGRRARRRRLRRRRRSSARLLLRRRRCLRAGRALRRPRSRRRAAARWRAGAQAAQPGGVHVRGRVAARDVRVHVRRLHARAARIGAPGARVTDATRVGGTNRDMAAGATLKGPPCAAGCRAGRRGRRCAAA